jgi:hypothetical protein
MVPTNEQDAGSPREPSHLRRAFDLPGTLEDVEVAPHGVDVQAEVDREMDRVLRRPSPSVQRVEDQLAGVFT